MDASTRRTLIDQYRAGYAAVVDALAGADDAALDRRPGPGTWSAREIVHHLADSEMTSAIRLRRLIAEDNPTIVGYDQEAFAVRLHYDRPIASSLEAFRWARVSTAEILDRLTEDDWARSGHAQRERRLQRHGLARDLRRARDQARRPDPPRARLKPRPGLGRASAGPRPGGGREMPGPTPGRGREQAGRRPGIAIPAKARVDSAAFRGRAEGGRSPGRGRDERPGRRRAEVGRSSGRGRASARPRFVRVDNRRVRSLRILVAALSGLLPAAAAAQTLTLQDAIASALAKNRDVVVERESVAQSREGIARAEAAFDPVLRGDTRYRYQRLPAISVLSGAPAGELAPTGSGISSAASFSQLFNSGASLTASTSVSRDVSNNFFTLISPAWFTALGVELRQPLLQGRTIDPARRAVRVSRASVDRSEASLRRVVAETVAAVEQAYWNVVAARRDVSIRESTLALADRQREDAKVRVEAQVAPESDLAQFTAEIERRRGDLFASREVATRAELLLKALILDSADAPQWNTTLTLEDLPAPSTAPVDLETALKDAAERPELADVDARQALQAIELDAARDRLKPQLDIVGGYTRARRRRRQERRRAALPRPAVRIPRGSAGRPRRLPRIGCAASVPRPGRRHRLHHPTRPSRRPRRHRDRRERGAADRRRARADPHPDRRRSAQRRRRASRRPASASKRPGPLAPPPRSSCARKRIASAPGRRRRSSS